MCRLVQQLDVSQEVSSLNLISAAYSQSEPLQITDFLGQLYIAFDVVRTFITELLYG